MKHLLCSASGKPLTISETGAGGVYEWQNQTDPYWSQKYQEEVRPCLRSRSRSGGEDRIPDYNKRSRSNSQVVSADANFAIANDSVTGITMWQFNDIKVYWFAEGLKYRMDCRC